MHPCRQWLECMLIPPLVNILKLALLAELHKAQSELELVTNISQERSVEHITGMIASCMPGRA
jgi:hypothetical protein